MKVEIVKRETIKPSSPTPHHLRDFKLSHLDQISRLDYMTLVLFYPSVVVNAKSCTEKSQRLKASLSETLTRFYPLAGRIKDTATIDCSDEGVSYLEARVLNCLLDDILKQPETETLKRLAATDDLSSIQAGTGCLLLVQINFFDCSGVAIGVSFSHKLSDAATFCTFIKAWSIITIDKSGDEEGEAAVLLPDLNAAKIIFPPNDLLPISPPPPLSTTSRCVTRRLLFHASKIAALKAKAASVVVPQPTRVEAVSALIWKCATTASRSNSSGGGSSSIRLKSVIGHAINLRKRIVPHLSEYSFGNLIGYFAVQIDDQENDLTLQSMVGQLRKGMKDFCDNYASKLNGENGVSLICESLQLARRYMMERDAYTFTSWCRFPLYQANFGWGNPAWVGTAISANKNTVILMDTRDGDGIQAVVSLTQEDMALFERDAELLDFASINSQLS